jgi:hopanoid biosynthesis associated protein HpnK
MKKVIINADDFGLSKGVNEGIILAHQKGILTSTSLITNMPGFAQAVELAKQNERLGVGLHLNIVRGQPFSPVDRVESLLNKEQNFFSNIFIIVRKLWSKKIKKQEIELEFRAQIEKALENNLQISHFDSEKHIHCLPSLLRIVLKLGREYNIKKLRYINEYCLSPRLFQSAKSVFASLSCSSMKEQIMENGVSIPDRSYGIGKSGLMSSSRIKKILSKLKDGVTEIMVHPGFMTQELMDLEKEIGSFYINKYREKELKALLDKDLKQIIKDEEISLINFNQL